MDNEIKKYCDKVQNYYDTEGKLKQYPSKKPLRILALLNIAEKFDLCKKYTEKDVNEIIRSSIAFGDVELIRRELFQYRLIGRLKDGSEYWAEQDWKELYATYYIGYKEFQAQEVKNGFV